MTDEQAFIQRRLLELGVEASFGLRLRRVDRDRFVGECIYTGREQIEEFSALLLVTGRAPADSLFTELEGAATRIGDCLVPSSIADAVYAGHRFAREYDEDPAALVPRRERVLLLDDATEIRA